MPLNLTSPAEPRTMPSLLLACRCAWPVVAVLLVACSSNEPPPTPTADEKVDEMLGQLDRMKKGDESSLEEVQRKIAEHNQRATAKSKQAELDALLGGPPAQPGKRLSRDQVKSGMEAVAAEVNRCGGGDEGTLVLEVIIGADGAVDSATAVGRYEGTEIGKCAARAVRAAAFPGSSEALTVKYPFKLDPTAIEIPDFVSDRSAACASYGEAANDIKRSAVFTEYFDGQPKKGRVVTDIIGTVESIDTPPGGDHVLIRVQTSIGEFSNNDALQSGLFGTGKRKIRKGSKLYRAIGELAEGAQIRFSGELVAPAKNVISEKESVCGDDWVIKYTTIEPR